MPRFFCDTIWEDTAVITGADSRHISRVLRMKPGDILTLSDGKGYDYQCEIGECQPEKVLIRILSKEKNQTEPDVEITLYQALPKGDKLDFIVQKAVELGVFRVVPILTKRCVARTDSAGFIKKRERLTRIAIEAAKQCGRGIIPEVSNILNFDEALAQMGDEPSVVFYEGGGRRLTEFLPPDLKSVSVFVGSEGGFEEEEIIALEEKGVCRATLGRRILRCETAPLAALTLLLHLTGEM